MAARAQMEQVKLEDFNLKGMKSTEISPQLTFIKQLTLVIKQYFFHACNKSDHLQLRPEPPLYSNFCVALAM